MDDLFRLQDDITRQVVDALSLPLAGMATSAGPDTPHDPRAYELYLRANELARTYDGLIGARDLYQRCVELDPSFAPAWAHLGRCHRVIVKYVEGSPDGEQKAEDALKHALQLNPRLSLAHRFYAGLEADVGHAREGMVRLLGEANRHGNDPELFAGLVHTCRYCGLFDEAIAAHAEARRLDPNVPTSVGQTVLMTGDFKKVLGIETPAIDPGADEGMRVIAFGLLGQKDEAREVLAGMSRPRNIPAFRLWTDNLRAWLDNQPGNMLLMTELGPLRIQDDPEAIFQQGWLLCDVGDYEPGLEHVQRAVAKGYYPVRTLSDCRQFDGLRSDARFRSVVADATAGRDQALEAFRGAGGVDLLGR